MKFQEFVSNKSIRNVWVYEGDMAVYVRRSIRMLDDPKNGTPCLDIGSVEVEEGERGKGIFTAFLKKFEEAASNLGRTVYVESIQNPRLERFLLRRGYKVTPDSNEIAPNMYKYV